MATEIQHYNPDIIVMQEVDEVKVASFWTPLLETTGLACVFHTFPKKAHGLLIAYRESLFSVVDELRINYDEVTSPEILQLNTTRNTGFAVALEFQPGKSSQGCKGIVLGNSHLFWHPNGSYERARQLAVLGIELERFGKKFENWPIILGGDFNSSPDDLPYNFLINRPKRICDIPAHTQDILKRSVTYLESKQVNQENAERATVDDHANDLISLYQQISDHTITSFYGDNYRYVHPENSLPADYYEPSFSNWAHSWRGLLDYIFYFNPRNCECSRVVVLELLRMPEPVEMGPVPNGQPRESQYPSDHLCIMAKISIH